MAIKRVEIVVTGLVQGINFRYYTRELAQKLGLVGWVKNEDDRTVRIIIEGKDKDLKKVIEWVKTGPQFARVQDVQVNWQESTGEFNEFKIEY